MRLKTGSRAGSQGASPFSRTMGSLRADGFRSSSVGIVVAVLLLALWLAWFLLARVARYEITDQARLEVDRAIYPIQAPVSGRVVAAHLLLDRGVEAGEVLVDVDSDPQRLQLEEERSRLSALPPQIAALRREIEAMQQARHQEQQALVVASEQAGAQHREGEARARYAEQEAERLSRLHTQGLISERDYMQGTAESERRRAAAESLQLTASRLEREEKIRESDRQANLDRLRGEMTRLQGEQSTRSAEIQRLQYEIERRRIRAPISGRLGEVAVLRIGAFVDEGDRLGAVVPPGTLMVVAEFLPPAALGRIQPGQPGQLRLDGYPWAQYGSIRATVTSVASEIRNGRVRVELATESAPASPIPLQHGLPGTVEVQVERISPAAMVLRAAGRLLASPRSIYRSAQANTPQEGFQTP
jgi:multidrug resistance efflux pump